MDQLVGSFFNRHAMTVTSREARCGGNPKFEIRNSKQTPKITKHKNSNGFRLEFMIWNLDIV